MLRRRGEEGVVGVGLVSERCGLPTEHPTGEREQVGALHAGGERERRSAAQRRQRHGGGAWWHVSELWLCSRRRIAVALGRGRRH